MEQSLRKTPVGLYVEYAGGSGTNLSGKNFTLQVDGDKLTLGIDLSSNLRYAKDTNQYIDARDLAERHDELEHVQIRDRQVTERLARALERTKKPAAVYLSLKLGEKFVSHRVIPQIAEGEVQLTVVKAV